MVVGFVGIDNGQKTSYSLRNAIRGDKVEAFHAGNIPANTLRTTDNSHTFRVSVTWKMGTIFDVFPKPGGDRTELNA